MKTIRQEKYEYIGSTLLTKPLDYLIPKFDDSKGRVILEGEQEYVHHFINKNTSDEIISVLVCRYVKDDGSVEYFDKFRNDRVRTYHELLMNLI